MSRRNKAGFRRRLGRLPALIALLFPALAAPAEKPGLPPFGGVNRLVAAEPALAALAASLGQALGDKPRPEQAAWLGGRVAACPGAAVATRGAARDLAIDCLERLYGQRLAVVTAAGNAVAWPKLRFRPVLVEGGGNKMCEDLHRDLVAGFLGRGLDPDPLGEREIGFAPIAGLGDEEVTALRADIDPYNAGKPFPVVAWRREPGNVRPATVQYVGYQSDGALLAAIGRGVAPLTESVRAAGKPFVEVAAAATATAAKTPTPFFALGAAIPLDAAPRFFRYDDKIYLLAPMRRAPDVAGDLAAYQFAGPASPRRLCLFEAHLPLNPTAGRGLPSAPVAAVNAAVAPLLPTGKLCAAVGEGPRTLAARAAWRPWALDRPWPEESGLPRSQLALYLQNRALTGPEPQRRYQAYLAARNAAIQALAPFYQKAFGRTPEQAQALSALYLDRGVADRFVFDPDDDAVAALFAAGYPGKHALQQAALAGDTAALRKALRLEPAALAAGAMGPLDESLLTDAIGHPDTLRALLEMGLDPNRKGASGRTPLMVAARLDLADAAGLLLAHGADPNAGAGDAVAQSDLTGDPQCLEGGAADADTPGRTALSYAAERASPALVRLLLDHGAGKDRADTAGRRPVDYLARRGESAEKPAIALMLR